MGVLRVLLAFVISAIVLTLLAVIAQSIFVIRGLVEVGAPFELMPSLSMIAADIVGLGPVYGVIIAIGLAVAFLVAWLVSLMFRALRVPIYAVAGAVCVMVVLLLMQEVFFGVQLIAGARSTAGFVAQMLAGLLAGYVFARLSARPESG